jgi:hypothetical protein
MALSDILEGATPEKIGPLVDQVRRNIWAGCLVTNPFRAVKAQKRFMEYNISFQGRSG